MSNYLTMIYPAMNLASAAIVCAAHCVANFADGAPSDVTLANDAVRAGVVFG